MDGTVPDGATVTVTINPWIAITAPTGNGYGRMVLDMTSAGGTLGLNLTAATGINDAKD